jgi:hypothetical protein
VLLPNFVSLVRKRRGREGPVGLRLGLVGDRPINDEDKSFPYV